MKVRHTITIDSELEKEIYRILDDEIKKYSHLNYKKLQKIKKKLNFSTVVNDTRESKYLPIPTPDDKIGVAVTPMTILFS